MTKKKRPTKSEAWCLPPDEASGFRGQALLSPRRAFVVQFRTETAGVHDRFTGRVEHIVSGRAARFFSTEELLAFFARILSGVHD